THFEEAGIGIVIREFLVFVVIGIRNIGFANAAQGTVPIDFCEDTDFETPVTWNSVGPGEIPHHGKLAGQRIPKAVKKGQERMRSHELLETPDHGGDEQACHPAMKPVSDAAVIAFAEFITEIRIGDGIAEACQVLSAVACDITIVECDDLAVVSGQDIAEGRPTATPLTLETDIEVVIDQGLEKGLDARTVIPDEAHPLREDGKKLFRQAKFQG